MTVAELDALPEAAARDALAACCGATPWVAAILAKRPWRTPASLLAAAAGAWAALTPADLAEAIAHHPRLGESRAKAALGARASGWSAGEQAGALSGADDARAALARANLEYERRFGHTFILCASGKSAEDMLASLHERLANTTDAELAITAEELRKITWLRLEKLLAGG